MCVGFSTERCRCKLSQNRRNAANPSTFGTSCAIITIVTHWTIILAIFVLLSHCVALFWPRKPLKVPLDENGLPVLWCNETEQKKDIACVWWDEDTVAAPAANSATQRAPLPVTSFSETVRPLSTELPARKCSVA